MKLSRLHRTSLLLFSIIGFILAASAWGQVGTSTVPEPTPIDLFETGRKVYNDWASAGALMGVIALVKLLIDVTKLKVVDDWLWDHQWRWVRPVLAIFLGGLLQVTVALQMKGSVPVAFIYGALAGASSIGLNELVGMFRKSKELRVAEAPAIQAYEAEKAKNA